MSSPGDDKSIFSSFLNVVFFVAMLPFIAVCCNEMQYVTLTGFGASEKVTVASFFVDPFGFLWILLVVPVLFSSVADLIKPNNNNALRSIAFLLLLYYWAYTHAVISGGRFANPNSMPTAGALFRGFLSPPDAVRSLESSDICRSMAVVKKLGSFGVRTMMKGCTFRITLPVESNNRR